MGAGPRSCGPGGRLVRVVLQPADQFVQLLRRQRRPADDELRAVPDQADRLEVVQDVVLQRIDGTVENMRSPVTDDDGVAVRRRARHSDARQRARCASDVFDDDGLPQRPSHLLGEDARQHVGGPAGGERHDERDLPRWKGLPV